MDFSVTYRITSFLTLLFFCTTAKLNGCRNARAPLLRFRLAWAPGRSLGGNPTKGTQDLSSGTMKGWQRMRAISPMIP
ncbi:hypothetical protein QBC45DRAFT_418172 [Copromyces sp. CBS 386.78]|nr:hypothetical protein QBC45DRAFT_418172 [Copromyces sp. CBS 386.78]